MQAKQSGSCEGNGIQFLFHQAPRRKAQRSSNCRTYAFDGQRSFLLPGANIPRHSAWKQRRDFFTSSGPRSNGSCSAGTCRGLFNVVAEDPLRRSSKFILYIFVTNLICRCLYSALPCRHMYTSIKSINVQICACVVERQS